MNVTWLAINASYSHASMALPLLERCCCDLHDIRWSRVDATIHEQVSRVVEEVLLQESDVVMGTAYLFTVVELLNACRRIKRLRPQTCIILGGPEFLGDNRDFLEASPFIDAVVRGEGESVIVPLLRNLEGRDQWASIPGICFRTEAGTIHDDGRSAQLLNATEIPDPTESPLMDWSKDFVLLETSRGCPAHCSFCTSALSDGVRVFSQERIRSTLQRVRQAKIREVRILDRTFNHPPERAVKLLGCFLNEFPEMWFHLEVYPNLLNEEIMNLIESAAPGRLHLEIGLQSTEAKILRNVHRQEFGKKSRDSLRRLCSMEQIPVHVDLLAGLPGQRIEDIDADLRFLSEYCPEQVQLEVLKILKGTPLAGEVDRFGVVYADCPPYEVLRTSTISFSDMRRAQRLSRILDAYYGHEELRPVTRRVWRDHPDFWKNFEAFLIDHIDTEVPQSLTRRYHMMHRFLVDYDVSAAETLEIQWLKNGHSPLKGLVSAELWKDDIPSDSTCLRENSEDAHYRDSRTYRIRQSNRDYWIRLFRKGQKQAVVLGEWVRPFDS